MPSFAEFDEAALPPKRKGKARGVEARGFLASLYGDALGYDQGTAPDDTAEQDAFVREIPSSILPRDGVVLITPMSLLATI
jgi:hypothetical protein